MTFDSADRDLYNDEVESCLSSLYPSSVSHQVIGAIYNTMSAGNRSYTDHCMYIDSSALPEKKNTLGLQQRTTPRYKDTIRTEILHPYRELSL